MNGPLTELPDGLPIPDDDGGASHLIGMPLPTLSLTSTSGESISLADWLELTVIFAYPMTGEPGKPLPTNWISIPGAAGCTLESCGFRDHYEELVDLGVTVFGLSTQSSSVQQEARVRLGLPFDLLSDNGLEFTKALRLPAFSADGFQMTKRLTLICDCGLIQHVYYPVYPPDSHADEVVGWLRDYRSKRECG